MHDERRGKAGTGLRKGAQEQKRLSAKRKEQSLRSTHRRKVELLGRARQNWRIRCPRCCHLLLGHFQLSLFLLAFLCCLFTLLSGRLLCSRKFLE
jgi:hypothetical protein